MIKIRKVLITDYDLCAIAYNGSEFDMISLPFIEFALTNAFIGFYGCTHRCYRNMNFVIDYATKHLNRKAYNDSDITRLATTTKATENIENRTGLPCFAVSTFEDTVKGKICGQGFIEIIKPYEEKGIIPEFQERASFSRFILFNRHDKKAQLKQIATHVRSIFPIEENITLHYVEDNPKIITNAFEVVKDKNWPLKVQLSFFWHSGDGDNATITKVRNARELQKAVSSKRI